MPPVTGPYTQLRDQFIPFKRVASCEGCLDEPERERCPIALVGLLPSELVTSAITLPRHTPLFKQGEQARSLYIVCHGYMKLSVNCGCGHQMVIQIAGPGSVLGPSSAFSPEVFEVSAQSITYTMLKAVDRRVFLKFLKSHSEIQERALRSLGRTYDSALEAAARLGGMSNAVERMGKLLLDLGRQVGKSAKGTEVVFPLLLTYEELGSMVGLTRETVTRILTQFRKAGWISLNECCVTIHHPENLWNPDGFESNGRIATSLEMQELSSASTNPNLADQESPLPMVAA